MPTRTAEKYQSAKLRASGHMQNVEYIDPDHSLDDRFERKKECLVGPVGAYTYQTTLDPLKHDGKGHISTKKILI